MEELIQRIEALEAKLERLEERTCIVERAVEEKPKKTVRIKNTDTWYAKNKSKFIDGEYEVCECGCKIKRFFNNMEAHRKRNKHIRRMAMMCIE